MNILTSKTLEQLRRFRILRIIIELFIIGGFILSIIAWITYADQVKNEVPEIKTRLKVIEKKTNNIELDFSNRLTSIESKLDILIADRKK